MAEQQVRLSEIVEFINGDRGKNYPSQADFLNQGIPFIGMQHISDGRIDHGSLRYISQSKYDQLGGGKIQRFDLLYCLRGNSVGSVGFVPDLDLGAIASSLVILRCEEPEDARFLYYVLSSQFGKELAACLDNGSAQPNISATTLGQQRVPFPSPEKRNAIASILGALDDKIELNRRMNATLESLARAIFKSWFVDFDPVKINAGQMPASSQALATHDPKVLDLFPSTFQDSELGPIPDGWSVGTIGDTGENPRRTIKPDEIPADSPYIALEHMPRRSIALGDWDVDEEIKSNKYRFHRGEILFGKLRPYFHKVGVPALDGVCSTDILVVVPRNENHFGYLLGHMSSDELVEYTNKTSTGTKMPRTNWKDISAYDIVVPPDEVLEEFNSRVLQFVGELHANIFEAQTLAKLRATLLPQLLSGSLRPDQNSMTTRVEALANN